MQAISKHERHKYYFRKIIGPGLAFCPLLSILLRPCRARSFFKHQKRTQKCFPHKTALRVPGSLGAYMDLALTDRKSCLNGLLPIYLCYASQSGAGLTHVSDIGLEERLVLPCSFKSWINKGNIDANLHCRMLGIIAADESLMKTFLFNIFDTFPP
tara:strand:+ start:2684 stop:3151 length:468 start_codon:yes stop_codon:yes gene_type:complete